MSDQAGCVVVKKGDVIPFHGKVIDGYALVDESACSGVSTPVWIDNSGPAEVWADALIVEGWLSITRREQEFAPPAPASELDDLPPPPATADETSPEKQTAGNVACFFAAFIALMLGGLCAFALTHSRAVALITGCITAVVVVLDTRRHKL